MSHIVFTASIQFRIGFTLTIYIGMAFIENDYQVGFLFLLLHVMVYSK